MEELIYGVAVIISLIFVAIVLDWNDEETDKKLEY